MNLLIPGCTTRKTGRSSEQVVTQLTPSGTSISLEDHWMTDGAGGGGGRIATPSPTRNSTVAHDDNC